MPRKPGAAEARPASVPLSTDFCADDADVIIRAAGTLDFRVHKLILSFASPVFRDMFTLPQPPADTPGILPRIDISESPETWDNILRTIYPMPRPILDDLDGLGSLLLAAKKYGMDFILYSHKSIFGDRRFIQQDPLHLYTIACACGFEDLAKHVARNAENLAVTRRSGAGNLEGLTIASYHRLVSFLAERDDGWHKTFSGALVRSCACDEKSRQDLYNGIRENLKRPSLQPKDICLGALEVRSRFIKQGCNYGTNCVMTDHQIDAFVKKMLQERETLCDKFMW